MARISFGVCVGRVLCFASTASTSALHFICHSMWLARKAESHVTAAPVVVTLDERALNMNWLVVSHIHLRGIGR